MASVAEDERFREFQTRVFQRRPLRHRLDRLEPGRDVVVAGDSKRWPAGTRRLEHEGFSVFGYYDILGTFADPSHLGRPVQQHLRGPMAGKPVVFVHRPSKIWFSSCEPGHAQCFWLDPPGDNHVRMGHDSELLQRSGDALTSLFHRLADEPSRDCLAAVVRARLEGDCAFFQPAPYAEYMHPFVHAEAGDIVVDGGAYTGDVTEVFAKQVGPHGRVIAMEPDPSNLLALHGRTQASGLKNVIPVGAAAWHSSALLSFGGSEASAKICNDGPSRVPAISIDELVATYLLPRVDLIKLDVEGAESAVLEGAQQTIQRFRPKLQISAYHRRDDLTQLALQIDALVPGYQMYMGHHNYYHTETDLYCTPPERLHARLQALNPSS